jgi:hypothetical protein
MPTWTYFSSKSMVIVVLMFTGTATGMTFLSIDELNVVTNVFPILGQDAVFDSVERLIVSLPVSMV